MTKVETFLVPLGLAVPAFLQTVTGSDQTSQADFQSYCCSQDAATFSRSKSSYFRPTSCKPTGKSTDGSSRAGEKPTGMLKAGWPEARHYLVHTQHHDLTLSYESAHVDSPLKGAVLAVIPVVRLSLSKALPSLLDANILHGGRGVVGITRMSKSCNAASYSSCSWISGYQRGRISTHKLNFLNRFVHRETSDGP